MTEFFFDMRVKNNEIYDVNDVYRLRIVVDDNYPFESPQVQFITTPTTPRIPIHPHIYSNGHICLDILGDKWVPVHNLLSVALSIHSLLANNTRNERPEDDKAYTRGAGLNPKNSRFVYHDDDV